MRLNLGCGNNHIKGWLNVDIRPGPAVDFVCDLTKKLVWQDDSVDEIYMSHVLEHIQNPLPLMQELYRVAKPGTYCFVRVPHGSHDMAHSDPTHKSIWFEDSFMFLQQPYYWRADYDYTADWQVEIVTYSMQHGLEEESASALHEMIFRKRNFVREMLARLVKVCPARARNRKLICHTRRTIDFEGGGASG